MGLYEDVLKTLKEMPEIEIVEEKIYVFNKDEEGHTQSSREVLIRPKVRYFKSIFNLLNSLPVFYNKSSKRNLTKVINKLRESSDFNKQISDRRLYESGLRETGPTMSLEYHCCQISKNNSYWEAVTIRQPQFWPHIKLHK